LSDERFARCPIDRLNHFGSFAFTVKKHSARNPEFAEVSHKMMPSSNLRGLDSIYTENVLPLRSPSFPHAFSGNPGMLAMFGLDPARDTWGWRLNIRLRLGHLLRSSLFCSVSSAPLRRTTWKRRTSGRARA